MKTWEAAFNSVGLRWPLKHPPYFGQTSFLDAIIQEHRPIEAVILPTGYGKTICQILYAAFLVLTGQVRHVVVLVPRDNLRSSMVDEWQTQFAALVSGAKVLNGSTEMLALQRYARLSEHIVMIASYQQISSELEQFCNAFPCAVIADEAHHLSDEGKWAKDTLSLRSDHKMYFTATPVRGDTRPLLGVPQTQDGEIDPLIPQITIVKAQEENALCRVRAQGSQFWLDVKSDDGIYRVTTTDLEQEREDFSTYEARKQLRYAEGFTTPLVEDMLAVHNRKIVAEPYKHQILVQAMSANHADYLREQINAIAGDNDFAHAVHMHKSNADNDNLLCRFRGVRRGEAGEELPIEDYERFPCLVQVAMAGEGYNNPYITTLVKADLTKNPAYVTQLIGRALRINYSLKTADGKIKLPQYVDILVPDDDTATIELINNSFATDAKTIVTRNNERESGDRGVLILDIPDVAVLDAGHVRTYDLNGDSSIVNADTVRSWANKMLPGWNKAFTFDQVRRAYITANGMDNVPPESKQAMSESALRRKAQMEKEGAIGKVIGNVIRILSNEPLHYTVNGASGRLKKAINTKWMWLGGVSDSNATADDFNRKVQWLREVNAEIKTGVVPSWLRNAYYDNQ